VTTEAIPGAEKSWLPTIGALLGAAIIVGCTVLGIAEGWHTAQSLAILALLGLLAGRWPLARSQVFLAAAVWFVVGCLVAAVGGAYVAAAAMPAALLALATWGLQRPSGNERTRVHPVVLGVAVLAALPVVLVAVMLLSP
jgi:hypothetical protein